MIKKVFLFAMALFVATTSMNADPAEDPIPLTPIITQPEHGGNPRSPIDIPVFYLDVHTLTASSYTVGSTVQLFDENDNVVFSTYIYIEGDIQLPTSLTGNYTIIVTRGGQVFEGEIELE